MEERLIGRLSGEKTLFGELSVGKIVVYVNAMSSEIEILQEELALARARIIELEAELGGKNAN